ncbi:hypothetical protein EIN_246880 [Entamoeba invadens IP1]|uniref:FAR1 domain-containing protein n=1 Tax=Entamoeba invadens IP1 TaxID=370355 RepID=A0A0A1UGD4_ENTIV|nr:hypothetical protein EIN_246880 [Entamoeba invadens IP1]ELP94794.1 hypothetical protein EIN_246880 [Entamoeba invadens IP1]|eukprot:XP_004261565.1 hypothetical protein EIN_246880 [Entamoeba invadens IP1]
MFPYVEKPTATPAYCSESTQSLAPQFSSQVRYSALSPISVDRPPFTMSPDLLNPPEVPRFHPITVQTLETQLSTYSKPTPSQFTQNAFSPFQRRFQKTSAIKEEEPKPFQKYEGTGYTSNSFTQQKLPNQTFSSFQNISHFAPVAPPPQSLFKKCVPPVIQARRQPEVKTENFDLSFSEKTTSSFNDISPTRTVFSPINLVQTNQTQTSNVLRYPRPVSATSEILFQPSYTHNSMFSPLNQNFCLQQNTPFERPQSVPTNSAVAELTIPKELETHRITKYEGLSEFQTYEEAMQALNEWAKDVGVVLRKGSGNNKSMKDGTKRKVVLVCQCSGKYRSCSGSPTEEVELSKINEKTKGTRKRRSKKTGCPFRINLNFRTKTNTWNITKMICEHNHL